MTGEVTANYKTSNEPGSIESTQTGPEDGESKEERGRREPKGKEESIVKEGS